jgi:hypothetical protein
VHGFTRATRAISAKAIASWGDGIQLMATRREIEAAIDAFENARPRAAADPGGSVYGDAYGALGRGLRVLYEPAPATSPSA